MEELNQFAEVGSEDVSGFFTDFLRYLFAGNFFLDIRNFWNDYIWGSLTKFVIGGYNFVCELFTEIIPDYLTGSADWYNSFFAASSNEDKVDVLTDFISSEVFPFILILVLILASLLLWIWTSHRSYKEKLAGIEAQSISEGSFFKYLLRILGLSLKILTLFLVPVLFIVFFVYIYPKMGDVLRSRMLQTLGLTLVLELVIFLLKRFFSYLGNLFRRDKKGKSGGSRFKFIHKAPGFIVRTFGFILILGLFILCIALFIFMQRKYPDVAGILGLTLILGLFITLLKIRLLRPPRKIHDGAESEEQGRSVLLSTLRFFCFIVIFGLFVIFALFILFIVFIMPAKDRILIFGVIGLMLALELYTALVKSSRSSLSDLIRRRKQVKEVASKKTDEISTNEKPADLPLLTEAAKPSLAARFKLFGKKTEPESKPEEKQIEAPDDSEEKKEISDDGSRLRSLFNKLTKPFRPDDKIERSASRDVSETSETGDKSNDRVKMTNAAKSADEIKRPSEKKKEMPENSGEQADSSSDGFNFLNSFKEKIVNGTNNFNQKAKSFMSRGKDEITKRYNRLSSGWKSRTFGCSKGQNGVADSASINSAYEVMGLDNKATDAEIRTRYRELIAKYHPDRFAGWDDQEFVRLADQKFRQVQAAYEELKRHRGF